jgi:hypothetical protein
VLGWWAVAAGAGLVIARAVFTTGFWYLPYLLFWLWSAALAITLLVSGLRAGRAERGARSPDVG